MSEFISDIGFSPTVKAFQEKQGSRSSYQRMAESRDWQVDISEYLAEFVRQRDSFYLATVNAEGQPYIQHRGGPKGFLKVLDKNTLGFAEFSGNRQYISTGNILDNPKVSMFLMDYPSRRRIKVWGEARFVDADHPSLAQLQDPEYPAKIERAMLITVTAWDVNCPQHITPRYTVEELQPYLDARREGGNQE